MTENRRLAKSALVLSRGANNFLYIDGEPFPWFTSVEGITAHISKGSLSTITVTILVDGPVEFRNNENGS